MNNLQYNYSKIKELNDTDKQVDCKKINKHLQPYKNEFERGIKP